MSKGKYILVNGSFLLTEEYRITLQESEAIVFSEKIRSVRSVFPFFMETLEVIRLKLLLFNQSFSEFTEQDGSEMKRQMERTLTKNKHFKDAVITLTFRFTGLKIHYTIQSETHEPIGYELNEKGLFVEADTKLQKAVSSLSGLSIGSDLYWTIAQCHRKDSTADQLLILNTDNHIVDIPESNLYTIKGKTIRGAGREQGAYMDITRPVMLDIFRSLNLVYSESEGIRVNDIQECEEILIVNAIEGVRWVAGYEGKRFFNTTIRKISELFNRAKLS